MSWRTVIISKSAKLDYQLGFVVVRGEKTTKIHIGEIYALIIETTSVSITAALLSELTKKKVKVIFCDEKRNPSSELVPYYGAHDTSMKVRLQVAWSEETKKAVWTEIVSEKIRKQSEHLKNYGASRASVLLEKYIMEMTFADETNREGHAAKVYFDALFGLDFTRTAENSINAALNYGYGIILSAVNREIAYNGYVTQLGLFHDNMFNQFNLGSDLMEPFRPLVDKYVVRLGPQKFDTDEKRYMIELLEEEVVINDRSEYLINAIKIYVRSVFDALNENDVSLIKFYKDEL